MMLRNAVPLFASALLVCAPLCAAAQQNAAVQKNAACGPPPVVAPDLRPNYFSEQQEEWLGEAMAAQVEAEFRLVRDPAANAYLQAIVDKLAATLPDTHIHFTVQLIDSPEVNGFSLAGGHIYLTRKLAAEANSDDELASVLGHEMGHIASHQFAFETTRDLKKLMGVTSVGDRADIFAKFQRLEDARMRAHSTSGGDDDDKQEEADRIGVYVTAAAGYRPQASAEFWDRMFFTKGKSGGTFSDFFGFTKPNERRLGKIQKLAASLPPGCGGQQAVRAAGFAAWHQRVMENRAVETAHIDGAREIMLTPPLRMDLSRLRFSPDGSKILAQDESTIYVLSRDPLSVDFEIDAPDALAAQFSPDSRRIVFTTQGLHTEEWSIEQKKLLQVHEPLSQHKCVQAKLSPDGRTVICMSFDPENQMVGLSMLDSGSGNVVWEKKDFFEPSFLYAFMMFVTDESAATGEMIPSSFSADGNYLLMGPADRKIALDLRTRTQVKIGGALARVNGPYAFLGSDRVAGENANNVKDSGIFSFPEGKLLKKVELPFTHMEAVSSADGSSDVIADGYKEFNISLVDVDKSEVVLGSESDALDVWNGTLANENRDGTITLRKFDGGKLSTIGSRVQLPQSQLGTLRAVVVSRDGRYLAASTKTRGALWDLSTGKQMLLLRGFRVGWNGDDDLLMEFPKVGKLDASLADVSLAKRRVDEAPYPLKEMHIQDGMLSEWKSLGKQAEELIVHRTSDGSVLWTRTFSDGTPEYTESYGWKDLLFSFRLNSSYAKSQLKANPKLANEAAALRKKDNAELIEVVDVATGNAVESLVLQLPEGSYRFGSMNRVGEQFYVSIPDHRTLVYSLTNGQQTRQLFGTVVAADPATGRVCLKDRQDEAIVYDAEGKELAHIHTGSPLRFAGFVDSGAKLVLLSADQIVRMVPIAAPTAMSVASAK